jgi:pimeloyl-ACP methyl ester carboxylesterase
MQSSQLRGIPMDAMSVPTQHLQLPDGGVLAFAIYGRPGGRPVHFFHGFPSSRLLAALVHEKAEAANVCLVAADRPGFGESTATPGRTLADWPLQVLSLADHLNQPRFDVIGVSCGGAYALACAADIPERIGKIALLAGMGPMDVPEIRRAQMPALKAMFALARIHLWLASPMFLLDRAVFRGDPDRALRMVAAMLTTPDRAALAKPEVGRRFVASMAEAYRQGTAAAMGEARLIAQPRPYRLEDIRVPVHVFQGHCDRHVPEAMGDYLARTIPNAQAHVFSDEGHLSIVCNRFDECLAALA